MTDPIVEEVRRHRDAHARQFNYDLKAICTDLKRRQEQSSHRVVRLSPKPASRRPLAPAPHSNATPSASR